MRKKDKTSVLKDQAESLKQELESTTALALIGMGASLWAHSIISNLGLIEIHVQLIRHSLEQGNASGRIEASLDLIEEVISQLQETRFLPSPYNDDVTILDVDTFLKDRFSGPKFGRLKAQGIESQLELSSQASVRVNGAWFARLINLLVENAVVAMEHCSRKRLTLSTTLAGTVVAITITDTGVGIPEPLLPKLFKEPIRHTSETRHLGIGLLLARLIASVYKGNIELARTGPQGTSMRILLPKA